MKNDNGATKKKARALFAKGINFAEIGKRLGVPSGTVRAWASREDWKGEKVLQHATPEPTQRNKGGAPKGNTNAVGHGAPSGNMNAAIHGLYSKALPPALVGLMSEGAALQPQAVMWWNIQALQARIVRAMGILWAKEGDTQRLKKAKGQNVHKLVGGLGDQSTTDVRLQEIEIETTEPWQVEEKALTAISRAMGELRNLLRDYEALYGADPRTELVRKQTEKLALEIADAGKDGEDAGPDPEGFTTALDNATGDAWADYEGNDDPDTKAKEGGVKP